MGKLLFVCVHACPCVWVSTKLRTYQDFKRLSHFTPGTSGGKRGLDFKARGLGLFYVVTLHFLCQCDGRSIWRGHMSKLDVKRSVHGPRQQLIVLDQIVLTNKKKKNYFQLAKLENIFDVFISAQDVFGHAETTFLLLLFALKLSLKLRKCAHFDQYDSIFYKTQPNHPVKVIRTEDLKCHIFTIYFNDTKSSRQC